MSHQHRKNSDDAADDVAPLAFSFDAEHHREPRELIELLGGKGCGLAVMTAMGLPVPPGFTLTTEACRRFDEDGWTEELDLAVRAGLAELEHTTGARLGDRDRPLLVSVRSGAEVSMPGMMDTVLDVGMTDEVAAGLALATGDAEFAADTARRALVSYASVVFAAPPEAVATVRRLRDTEEVRAHLAAYGLVVPRDPVQQVIAAVQAVFRSWASPRAEHYRRIQGIDETLGTAATVQAMVFGNLGPDSGTGVAFTRDPSTGRRGLVGDFLVHAQGEDVVAGDRATRSLTDMEHRWPDTWTELVRIAGALEQEFADMVDIEFTVERGRLWILQARRGKRGAAAAMRIAVEMADDPDFPLDRRTAVERCRHLLEPVEGDRPADGPAVDRSATVLATGLAASPGRAAGELCVDIDDAVRRHEAGSPVVLVRRETSPADVQGMAASVGLVTTLGGLVSHAAVVARSWGIPAVVGAEDLVITDGGIRVDGADVGVGEVVTVDGDAGRLLLGDHGADTAEPPEAEILRVWAADLADG
jgi:pyruvate,orthophosphate dikinase